MRARFRLHLATVVVLTLVAGVLVGLNVRGRVIQSGDVGGIQLLKVDAFRMPGWPLGAGHWPSISCPIDRTTNALLSRNIGNEWRWDWKYAIPVNAAAALAILLGTGFVCELFMRRSRPAGTVATRLD